MVLRARTAGQQVPGFEQDDSSAAAVKSVAPAPELAAAAVESAVAAASVEASVAVAKAGAATAVVPHKERPKMRDFIGELQDQFAPIGFGESPRLVAASGVIKDADKQNLGTWAELTLLSWNYSYTIRTGDQSDEAKEKVRYSKDKERLPDGTLIADYLKELKTVHGYDKASCEEYVELVGLLEDCEKPYALKGAGRLVVISLAPDSVKTFTGLRRDTAVGVMLGSVTPSEQPKLRVTTEARNAKGRDWTRLVVSYQQ